MKNGEAMKCLPSKDRMMRIFHDMIDGQNLTGSELSSFSLKFTNKELAQLPAFTP
ncbi:MAG TPA: hypothetical protein VEI57_05680 [Nitrospirota bacterium]|nr:hypothetical protein [Nitrospirota bacterium]